MAHKRRKRCVMTKRGVTFWELLAVLAIIAVVAAILYPVFHKAYGPCGGEEARHISCLSQEKQLGLALLQYTENNDNFLPNIADPPGSRRTWRTALTMFMPYLRTDRIHNSIFHCPDAACSNGPDGLPVGYAANYSGTYNGGPLDKGNGAFAGPGSYPLSLSKFPEPDKLILLCEVDHSTAPEFNIDDPVRFPPTKHILSVRHSDGSNYLLADGHSKWYRPFRTGGLWYRDPEKPLSANAQVVLRSGHD